MTVTAYVVAGRRASCDQYGPTNRLPCSVDAVRSSDHDPHWWVAERGGFSWWWCGGSLDRDWRMWIEPVHGAECALNTTHHLTCTCGAYSRRGDRPVFDEPPDSGA